MKNSLKLKLAAATSAVATAFTALAAHAQVTFSATAPQATLTNVTDGAIDFFWDNATGVILTVAAIGIVMFLVSLVLRKLSAGKKRPL